MFWGTDWDKEREGTARGSNFLSLSSSYSVC
jgi:hypothetical protein